MTARSTVKLSEQPKQASHRKRFPIDPIFMIISLVSLSTRIYKLEYPRAVVFDELHYIRFVTLYIKRIFFFDPQPPFGKQLFALFAWLIGFHGDLDYSQIGDAYKSNVPIWYLRLMPCLLGSLFAPFSYLIALELRFRRSTAALVAALIILENSLLTQSRFLLLDSTLILLSIFSVYCYLRFIKNESSLSLALACASATLAALTKYSGFYTYAFIVSLTCYHWWSKIEGIKCKRFMQITIIYAFCLFLGPVLIYLGIYYVHLSWLVKAGPHDSIMTSAFQASLENGLASITRGQPLEIVHGSQITLRHSHGRSCWLHSHDHVYPVKYADGRGSSHQQQVTCYSFKDVNNWWIVKRPDNDDLVASNPRDAIKDGDVIQLLHGMTSRALNSHDVASAVSPYSQEVSCYIDYDISMSAQSLWRVKLINSDETGGTWHTINSEVQLIHLNTSLALKFSGKQLPDWGFHQHEIVTDKDLTNIDTIWNVEEHRYTKSENQQERELELGQAEFVPLEPTSLTFFDKFYELNYKLLTYQHDSIKDHIYACESPLDWIFMRQGTAYWVNNTDTQDNAQIFLIGNTSISTYGNLCIVVLVAVLIFCILRRRRNIHDVNDWKKLEIQSIVLLGGFIFHLGPYFLYESPLFLQFYLTAFIFQVLIIGSTMDLLMDLGIKSYIVNGLMVVMTATSFDTFMDLCPLSYGLSLSGEEVEKLRWKDTWQLINLSVTNAQSYA